MNRIRLMIVDDREEICSQLGTAIEMTTVDAERPIQAVAIALNGYEAITRADEFTPDVILMDLEMPGLGGLTAAKRIKGKHPEMIILAFTIHDSPATHLAVEQANMDGLISKGTSLTMIVEEINRFTSVSNHKKKIIE